MFDVLIKVGGSLYNEAELRSNVAAWSTLAKKQRLLVLPGGGPFAAAVRQADDRFTFRDSTAHWMAILAMDQYAYLLADLAPNVFLVRDLTTAATICDQDQLPILAPSSLLLKLNPLPHSWHITSDSIAAWLANEANIPLLVLLKSVAGVYQVDPHQDLMRLLEKISREVLAQHDIVDACFTRTLSDTTTCWIIDGGEPGRLAELLRRGSTLGTKVMNP